MRSRTSAHLQRDHLVLVSLLFCALTLVFTWPLPLQVSSHLVGTGTDPELLIWAMAWDAHAFVHQPWSIFDANIFYPSHHALAYSENMIGSALLVAPVIWSTGDLVLAMNLVQMSSVTLSAIGAYVLARRLGLETGPAVVAGLIFGFAPARFFRMGQAHLTTIQWIPFCLAYLHAYTSPEGRSRHLKLAAVFFTLQALASGHGAVLLTVAITGLAGWQLLGGAPVALTRRCRDLGWLGALALLPAVLVVLPYWAARTEVPNLRRGLDEYGSSLSSYVSSPVPLHQWLLSHAPAWVRAEPPDAHLFVGLGPLVLAGIGVAAYLRQRPGMRAHPVPFYAALAAVSFWFTLGPPFGLWQWTYWMPVFSFLRVPSRFVLLEVLALAILSGFGLRALLALAPSSRRWAASVGVASLLVLEFMPWGLATRPFQIPATAADRWLAGQPEPVVVAEIPVPATSDAVTQARRNTWYMLHSTVHWQKIVHGYSGVEPAHFTELRPYLSRFPDDDSLRALVDRGVTHVVLHPELYDDEAHRADAEARFERYRDWLRIEYVSRDGRVYSLHRPAQ